MKNIAISITIEIHTNRDSVRPTAAMLRSIADSPSSRFPVIALNKAAEITSAALRVNN